MTVLVNKGIEDSSAYLLTHRHIDNPLFGKEGLGEIL